MSKYTSKATVVNQSAQALSAKFSDFSVMQSALDKLDAEQRSRVGDVCFTNDSIKISTPQVGDITLKAVERTDERIRLEAIGSPIPMTLLVDFKPINEESTEVTGTIDVDLPMMIRPLVGPTLQKAADQFGDLFARLA
ncbi:MAG: hypothetical protein J1F05_05320 [Muribaculaceae bacterium]|nr:hypothetical protein [Muribaculaceae bacterium]